MENNNTWQKCPVCNGSGASHVLHGYMYSCGTCDGHGIISTLSGAPPGFKKYQTSIGSSIGMTGESGHSSITGETVVKKDTVHVVDPPDNTIDNKNLAEAFKPKYNSSLDKLELPDIFKPRVSRDVANPNIDYTKNLRAEKEKKEILYAVKPYKQTEWVAIFKNMDDADNFAKNISGGEWYVIDKVEADIDTFKNLL
jgi:hypothetical protein